VAGDARTLRRAVRARLTSPLSGPFTVRRQPPRTRSGPISARSVAGSGSRTSRSADAANDEFRMSFSAPSGFVAVVVGLCVAQPADIALPAARAASASRRVYRCHLHTVWRFGAVTSSPVSVSPASLGSPRSGTAPSPMSHRTDGTVARRSRAPRCRRDRCHYAVLP